MGYRAKAGQLRPGDILAEGWEKREIVEILQLPKGRILVRFSDDSVEEMSQREIVFIFKRREEV